MPLLIGYDAGGLEPKAIAALDAIVAALQTWAGQIEGINAAERLNQLATGVASLPTPQPGMMVAYGGSTAPSGWLMCNGAAVSRTAYANLYTAIGTTYGVGDGTSTFNVPDLRQRFPLGQSASGTGATLGSTGGAIDHTHTGGTVSGSTASESSHTHTYSSGTWDTDTPSATIEVDRNLDGVSVQVAHSGHIHTTPTATETSSAGSSHSHSAGTLAVGTSGTANPPFQVVNYIVKT